MMNSKLTIAAIVLTSMMLAAAAKTNTGDQRVLTDQAANRDNGCKTRAVI